MMGTTGRALGAGLVVGLALGGPAFADGFALREQSTVGQGQDFAGVAAGSAGAGSMFWNPATMTDAAGLQTQFNAAALFPYASIKPEGGTSPILTTLGGPNSTGNIIPNALLPSGYASYQFNDRLWLGFAVNSPFGLITKGPTNYAGQIYARTSSVRSYDFNPTVAFKVTDWLSIGAGVQLLDFTTKLSEAVSPLPDSPSATLAGHGWGWGFTGGATIKPFAGTEIGFGYRSSVGIDQHGTIALGPSGTVPAKSLVNLPDQFSVGLRQVVTPDLTLSAEYELTRWSSLGTVNVINPALPLVLPYHYSDSSFVSVGGEYAYNQSLKLRAGVGYEWSPISITNRDLRLPEGDLVSLSIGAGYRFTDHLTADLAYSHLFSVGDVGVAEVPGNPHFIPGLPFVGKVSSGADIASVGVTYKW